MAEQVFNIFSSRLYFLGLSSPENKQISVEKVVELVKCVTVDLMNQTDETALNWAAEWSNTPSCSARALHHNKSICTIMQSKSTVIAAQPGVSWCVCVCVCVCHLVCMCVFWHSRFMDVYTPGQDEQRVQVIQWWRDSQY